MAENQAVTIVTIKNKIPLFKGEEKAERIELIELEENGFELVAGKDLYQIGDKAVFIQPDYNVSDIPLFQSFIRPENKEGIPDESKSMLGKVEGLPRRIRAKKFNMHKGDGAAVYSNGILLPFAEVQKYLGFPNTEKSNYTELLGITKWEEPENTIGGLKSGRSNPFPEGLYKTDETNINNLWGHIQFPLHLVGTEKVDGSSITIGVKNGKGFICSRNLQKLLKITKIVGKRNKTLLEKILFWTKPDLNIKEEIDNEDDFIKYGKPYLDKLLSLQFDNEQLLYDNIVFRGELSGGSLKGSGNKNNPAKNEKANIKFFGVDLINPLTEIAEKQPYEELIGICEALNFNIVKEIFNQEFNSKEDLLKVCNEYFSSNMIEGIVVRTLDSKFSAKIMSLEYDSKK